jgi:REP element-mobilizing transposase RayT
MVLAHHVIFGTYGFWLPNDPRGSWSDFVGAWEVFRFGPATKIAARRSVASRAHDGQLRKVAKEALRRPAVEFSGVQARAVARGFAWYAERAKVGVLACAVLPDHVHLVIERHRLTAEKLVIQLKAAATRQLLAESLHPFADFEDEGRVPKCFARRQWDVFLDSVEDIRRAVRYVEGNPEKEGKPRQSWSFVTAYGG